MLKDYSGVRHYDPLAILLRCIMHLDHAGVGDYVQWVILVWKINPLVSAGVMDYNSLASYL